MEVIFRATNALPDDVPSATVRGKDAVIVQVNQDHFASEEDAHKVCSDLSGNVDHCAYRDWIYIGDIETTDD